MQRLQYIGSKYPLLGWLKQSILDNTGYRSLVGVRISDLFAGTGIVSHLFRSEGAIVTANDAELYSSIITKAIVTCDFNDTVDAFIAETNAELEGNAHTNCVGFLTKQYSPFEDNKRMFFTLDNAKRIDYIRQRIEEADLSSNDRIFALASLLVMADTVSNVPAVYGSYLKSFKPKALKPLVLKPVHTMKVPGTVGSTVTCQDVLTSVFDPVDVVYMDPPYNDRQYSKNYFPLNVIAKTPAEQASTVLHGKTGIPSDCFLSAFCKKGDVESAFTSVLSTLKCTWLFLSYSNEGLVSKQRMIDLLSGYGTVTDLERPYKRFKSFSYNEGDETVEYLFCLKYA